MSCHFVSCHVMSCHSVSCHVMLCHIMSCHHLDHDAAHTVPVYITFCFPYSCVMDVIVSNGLLTTMRHVCLIFITHTRWYVRYRHDLIFTSIDECYCCNTAMTVTVTLTVMDLIVWILSSLSPALLCPVKFCPVLFCHNHDRTWLLHWAMTF